MGWILNGQPTIPPGDAASVTLPKLEALTSETPDNAADTAYVAASWQMVEEWTRTLWLPRMGGRQCVTELDVTAPCIVRAIPTRRLANAAIDTVELWKDSAYAVITSPKASPRGVELDEVGQWRITSTAAPIADDIPEHVKAAASRVYAWLYHFHPSRRADDLGGAVGTTSLAGAIRKSGAVSLLREYRRAA